MSFITTPFGFHSTALRVVQGVDLGGQRALVTGAASGIGIETARALAAAGAEVTLAVRDLEAGARVAADIAASTGNAQLQLQHLDLADLNSVHALARAWRGPLHMLINNAGVMAMPETRTAAGMEMQFATNHLGHFALALGLRPALVAAGRARVVSVSSSGHQLSPLIFDDIHFQFRPYDPWLAYGQSKTANILFAVGVTARWAGDGICCNALMPGAIATNLQRYSGGTRTPPPLRKTPEQGAATSVLLAASPLLAGVSGRYFHDCNETAIVTHRTDDMSGVAPYALDPAHAERLWEESLRLMALAMSLANRS
ncbi:MAG: SDR family NAD(P)-dependent oxidoreductase [Steroidobacteraceae bacterium]